MWGKPPEIVEQSGKTAGDTPPLDGFANAHADLVADGSIQFALPPAERPPTTDLPDMSWLANMAPVMRVLIWVVVGAIALWLLYLIVGRLTGLRFQRRVRDGAAQSEPQPWHMDEQPARALLSEADALAAQGRYDEAAHLLLYRSIDEVEQRRPDSVRKAYTSRDIAQLPALPAGPAEAFGGIVRAVERSLFGGRALAAADWTACRADYERFAIAEGWRR